MYTAHCASSSPRRSWIFWYAALQISLYTWGMRGVCLCGWVGEGRWGGEEVRGGGG